VQGSVQLLAARLGGYGLPLQELRPQPARALEPPVGKWDWRCSLLLSLGPCLILAEACAWLCLMPRSWPCLQRLPRPGPCPDVRTEPDRARRGNGCAAAIGEVWARTPWAAAAAFSLVARCFRAIHPRFGHGSEPSLPRDVDTLSGYSQNPRPPPGPAMAAANRRNQARSHRKGRKG